MKRLLILAALAALFLLAACGQPKLAAEVAPDRNPAGYTDVSVEQLLDMLDNKDFVMVNVFVPLEGNIPDTDVAIPFDQVAQNLDKLPADKDAKILVYCRSGVKSSIAAQTLVELGYTNIWNLQGGFTAWKEAGLPMIYE